MGGVQDLPHNGKCSCQAAEKEAMKALGPKRSYKHSVTHSRAEARNARIQEQSQNLIHQQVKVRHTRIYGILCCLQLSEVPLKIERWQNVGCGWLSCRKCGQQGFGQELAFSFTLRLTEYLS